MCLYDFTVRARDGSPFPLRELRGKVVLIVLTDPRSSFVPQYRDLQELYSAYGPRGLEILDFPCVQFGGGARGTADRDSARVPSRSGAAFPLLARVDVAGPNAEPLFRWLSESTEFHGFGSGAAAVLLRAMLKLENRDYMRACSVKWSFTKFLTGRSGRIIARFEPTDSMRTVARRVIDSL